LQFNNILDGVAAFLLGFGSQAAAEKLFGWLRSE
jgi:hypothetical protein